jgi:hypothetical protein
VKHKGAIRTKGNNRELNIAETQGGNEEGINRRSMEMKIR